MTLKFLGHYTRLRKCVSRTGVAGHWRELKNGHKQFRTTGGAILNWWGVIGYDPVPRPGPGNEI